MEIGNGKKKKKRMQKEKETKNKVSTYVNAAVADLGSKNRIDLR
jgi:hypothetical protein